MPPRRPSRDSSAGFETPSWTPIAAGVVVGVGLLALVYKLIFKKDDCNKGPKPKSYVCSVGPSPANMIEPCPKKASKGDKKLMKAVEKVCKAKVDPCDPCAEEKKKKHTEWCYVQVEKEKEEK